MSVVINGTSGVTFPDTTTQASALSTTTVLAATAGASVGAVGTYILGATSQGNFDPGTVRSGGELRYFGFYTNASGAPYGGQFVSINFGSWRCMGKSPGAPGTYEGVTLWLRIS